MTENGRTQAKDLATELVDRLGDRVISAILYGSAAREEFDEGTSDLNVLVVLSEVDESVLRACGEIARSWAEAGNPPPLLLAEAELQRSLDIFPIEYSEIREAHVVLHGSDPFADLEIAPEHLRLQCERELKMALIRLRERYLMASPDPKAVGELLRSSVSTFLVHYRTILRLEGEPVPADREEVVRTVATLAGFEAAPVLAAVAARASPEPFNVPAGDPTVVGYLDAAARVVEYVDRISA